MITSTFRKAGPPVFRKPALAALLLSATVLTGCATNRVPQFSYDDSVPPLPTPPAASAEDRPRPLHVPPAWTVARGGERAGTPIGRVENANAAARVEPRREGYYNAIQIYPWSEGALYQVYAAPGQITNIALEPGERLTGAGPIAAGDTTRWIIGDTESGSGANTRVHILVKPTREDISTNLVITTDRRVYTIELRAREALYMPSVAWAYPAPPAGQRRSIAATPILPAPAARNHPPGGFRTRSRLPMGFQGSPAFDAAGDRDQRSLLVGGGQVFKNMVAQEQRAWAVADHEDLQWLRPNRQPRADGLRDLPGLKRGALRRVMDAASVPKPAGVIGDQGIEIIHRDPRLGDVFGRDPVSFLHPEVRASLLLLAGRGRGPDEFGPGRVVPDRVDHLREPLPVPFDASMQAIVEMDHRIGVLTKDQFDLVEQSGITNRFGSSQDRDVSLVLERRADLGGVADRDRISDQQHQREVGAVGRFRFDGDRAPIVRFPRCLVIIGLLGPRGGHHDACQQRRCHPSVRDCFHRGECRVPLGSRGWIPRREPREIWRAPLLPCPEPRRRGHRREAS